MDGRAYHPRGQVIDRLAREKKNIRTAKGIAEFMRKCAGELGLDPKLARSRSTVGNYLYGTTAPDEDWLTLFALAFELTQEEMGELAFSHSFRRQAAP